VIRVISGAAKGRRLLVPPTGTRPTSERARAALFNRLDTLVDVAGSRVLDLYAGSGAIGLEALSRHAAEVWLVETDRRALDVLAANLAAVAAPGSGLSGVGRILRRPVAAVLAGPNPGPPFDLAFADPPYAMDEDELAGVLSLLANPRWTEAGAIVVVERASRGPEPRWPDRVVSVASKRYGEGTLWYGRLA
jgi:16S rRNA (guanine966-N2)-methyltransferase